MARFDIDDVLVLHNDNYAKWGDIKDELPAGTYYLMEETGVIHTREHDAEQDCWSNDIDESGKVLETSHQCDTYYEAKVLPWWIVRVCPDPYRPLEYVAFNKGPDNIPASMYAASKEAFGLDGDYDEVDTRDEALKMAMAWAEEWSKHTDDMIWVCNDTAIAIGDDFAVYQHGVALPKEQWPPFYD